MGQFSSNLLDTDSLTRLEKDELEVMPKPNLEFLYKKTLTHALQEKNREEKNRQILLVNYAPSTVMKSLY